MEEVVVEISPQYNNCSFHTLIPEFIKNFSSEQLKQTKGFKYFQAALVEYYYLENYQELDTCITLFFSKFSHPIDWQVLLGPVLRLTLKRILMEDERYKKALQENFKRLVEQCREKYHEELLQDGKGEADDIKQVIQFLRDLKLDGDEQSSLFRVNLEKIAKFLYTGETVTHLQSEEAYQAYVNYVGDLGLCSFVSFDELKLLYHSFNFDCQYVDHITEQRSGLELETPIVTVRIQNVTGDHWDRVDEEIFIASQSIFNQYHNASCYIQFLGADNWQLKDLQNAFRKKMKEWIVEKNEQIEDIRKMWRDAINRLDLFKLLVLYHTNPDCRHSIEKECKKAGENGKTLYNKIKFYYAQYLTNEKEITWEKFFENLPIIEDATDDTPLHQAIRKNDIQQAIDLIDDQNTKSDFSQCNKRGFNALHLACALDRAEMIEKILDPESHHQVNIGLTLIHCAAQTGSLEMLKYLMSLGETLNSKDQEGNTPLHIAVRYAHIEMVTFICEIYKKEKEEYTNLVKTDYRLIKIVGKIRQSIWCFQGLVDINALNANHESPYNVAIFYGHHDVAQVLKSYGANTDTFIQSVYKTIYPDLRNIEASSSEQDFASLEAKNSGIFAPIYKRDCTTC